MSNMRKAIKLQEAIVKLNEVNCLMQEALGATEECYDLHCAIEDIEETLAEYAEQLIEMQVTE